MAKRNISEEDLIEGAVLSAAPTLIYEASSANMVTI
jgi:predicted peroxiredoxin